MLVRAKTVARVLRAAALAAVFPLARFFIITYSRLSQTQISAPNNNLMEKC